MSGIEFVQYLMPNGRKRPQWIDRPPDITALANELRSAGVELSCEMLPDYNTISLSAEMDDADGETVQLAGGLCQNGPAVLDAVDKLIRTARQSLSERAKEGERG